MLMERYKKTIYYCLENGVSTITQDGKITGIAGVMGGDDSKIDEETKGIFIEAAVFDGGPHLQLRQEPQGTSDFRLRTQGTCRHGTEQSGLVLG